MSPQVNIYYCFYWAERPHLTVVIQLQEPAVIVWVSSSESFLGPIVFDAIVDGINCLNVLRNSSGTISNHG